MMFFLMEFPKLLKQDNIIEFNITIYLFQNAEMAKPEYMDEYEIITSKNPIVNAHGTLDETPEDGIYETQELVISTNLYLKINGLIQGCTHQCQNFYILINYYKYHYF